MFSETGHAAQNRMYFSWKWGMLPKTDIKISVFRAKQVLLSFENSELPKSTNIISLFSAN